MALIVSTPGSIPHHPHRPPDEAADIGEGVLAAVLTDRRRIASEMRAHAVRRLFSLGLAATSLRCRIEDEDLGRRLDEVISDLDRTITDLRRSIFELDGVLDPADRPAPTAENAGPEPPLHDLST